MIPHFNKKIIIRLTKYVQKHFHSYFQNHFGGSIIIKIFVEEENHEILLQKKGIYAKFWNMQVNKPIVH
jgi:hypothetical protein